MKSKPLAAITIILIVSIALASYAGLATAKPKDDKPSPKISGNFVLTATGTAKNADGDTVDVSISIQGHVFGRAKTVFHLRVKGGDATVVGYDAVSATKGQGVIVNKSNFIHLVIMMSAQYYGGRSTVWILRGTTEPLTGNTMPVSLEARRVVLPLAGYPQLTNLELEGTINFP